MDNFINGFESATIWGAGHQTLMFLTMMNSLDKVPYIVDDFEPKQHKYTHVSHKLILPCEELINNPVDAIIIVVGWQYRSVLRRIEELNLNPKPIIALRELEECVAFLLLRQAARLWPESAREPYAAAI